MVDLHGNFIYGLKLNQTKTLSGQFVKSNRQADKKEVKVNEFLRGSARYRYDLLTRRVCAFPEMSKIRFMNANQMGSKLVRLIREIIIKIIIIVV